ncbi:BTB/POZ domain [Dillenia turbinata]|uniref:BTB/POZ domain n=1 Tax=Dillenia turbinata TaxID=194707 RepID=A0AAN8UPH9_9MAGN
MGDILEVDVNGEESFFLNKRIICSYSGRLSKLFSKGAKESRNLKVIFHDFPGGSESFELMARFCYSNGTVEINFSNISLLHCAAHFMEMDNSVGKTHNLLEQTEKSLDEVRYWTMSELLVVLNRCQDLLPNAGSSGILERLLDSLVGRLALTSEPSPCPSTSSSDTSVVRFSSDSRSTESLKNSISRATWWFEDLSVLNPDLIEMVVNLMVSQKFDHATVSRFLFFYQKSKFVCAPTSHKKRKIIEIVINMLYLLDQSSISFKSLFGLLRVALNLNIGKSCRNRLENMIGSRMDQATLDNLLVPSPPGSNYLYDVNLILRFLKSFLSGGIHQVPLTRLQKVASLIDVYIAEVAPDPCLKPSKFVALIVALPDSARDSHDEIYHAMDMYLQVHGVLSAEEKIKVCCSLNYDKLSSEVCIHLAQNTKFPSKSVIQALLSQKSKLKSILHDTNQPKSPSNFKESDCKMKDDDSEQILLYAGKLNVISENERLRAHLQGMQWRVMELEKVCEKMQTQMTKIMKSRSPTSTRSLPRLCS